MTTTARFQVRPLDPAVLNELRERDDAGRVPRVVTETQERGAPLRCCLRRGRPGERIALLSYAPLRRWSRATGADVGAYDEVGPVFVHAEPCDGPDRAPWPEELRGDRRVLRAYSEGGRILGGRLLDTRERTQLAERTADELLADPAVALVHVRAVEFGCFLFEVRRVGS
ncbi:hypothetical protein FHR84_002888 [Actinopolyspora biskrensis]|uniref:DUF1203 domain-containing protein n=1 Tax=Actinopolyspora biskrensis TaxID=1470178 RepID=A0A852YZZ7_9ACTN|nr:DUF1203 domain-containing protein [Actinopolyspora biskrensis]NYH79550.1 hypothetical protein [Actinopolyspora biskrensis]